MSCVVPASTETTTRERERERERERDVRSFKTPARDLSPLLRRRRRLPRRRRPFKAARFLERIISLSKRTNFLFPKPHKVYWFRVYSSFFFF